MRSSGAEVARSRDRVIPVLNAITVHKIGNVRIT
jgi:hypothetical protein